MCRLYIVPSPSPSDSSGISLSDPCILFPLKNSETKADGGSIIQNSRHWT